MFKDNKKKKRSLPIVMKGNRDLGSTCFFFFLLNFYYEFHIPFTKKVYWLLQIIREKIDFSNFTKNRKASRVLIFTLYLMHRNEVKWNSFSNFRHSN